MAGTVITFYSYKGGVGRSFALVNIAALLGQWGFRVLCVDWDLEAPGLEDFFRPYLEEGNSSIDTGIVELLAEFAKTRHVPLEWRKCVQRLKATKLPGVEFIKAGNIDPDYMRRLQKLNWETLYKRGLGEALETMFDELRDQYDFVLIDARTGVTDFSGIVTAQLPDILAFLFTANEQSLGGATTVAKKAAAIRNDIAIDRSHLLLLPIPARFETQVEHYISATWRNRFASELANFYEGWAHRDVPSEKLVQASTIPYVPYWSFGERIATVDDNNFDSSSINYSMENLAALLAHRLGQTRLLVESRDEYVAAARRLGRNPTNSVFISHSFENRDAAHQIANILIGHGVNVLSEHSKAGMLESEALPHLIDAASHFVLLYGRNERENKYISDDARAFLRQAASDDMERQFIPLILPDTDPQYLPSLVRQYRYVVLDNAETAAEEVWARIQPRGSEPFDNSVLTLRATSDGDAPVKDAQVCALADNGTIVEGTTDVEGQVSLKLAPGKSYQILLAHRTFPAKIVKDFAPGRVVNVRMNRRGETGSVIIQSTGYIPDLKGRLNPIRDTSNRTYLYADNIAINGGKLQPVSFQLGDTFTLEDNEGTRYRVVVRLLEARTSLLEYRKVEPSG